MADEITKVSFKSNQPMEVEVIDLAVLTEKRFKEVRLPHRTDFYHVFLLEDCAPVHVVDFEPIATQPYSLLCIAKSRVHQFDQQQLYKGKLLIFTDSFFCATEADAHYLSSSILFDDLSGAPLLPLTPASFEHFMQIASWINEQKGLPIDSSTHPLLQNLVHSFLLLAEREKRKQGFTETLKNKDLSYTQAFRNLLDIHFTTHKNVSDYATWLFISEKRLGQATLKIIGANPKKIINDRVLLEAKRLLAYSNASVKEIGVTLGFDDAAYFVRYFRKNTGQTPSEFRALQIQLR